MARLLCCSFLLLVFTACGPSGTEDTPPEVDVGADEVGIDDGDLRAPAHRRARLPMAKPAQSRIKDEHYAGIIVLKLREGSAARLRDGRFVVTQSAQRPEDLTLLQRARLDRQRVGLGLQALNQLLESETDLLIRPSFDQDEALQDALRDELSPLASEELADLNLYAQLVDTANNPRRAEQLVDRLNALEVVEIAYIQPLAEPAAADIAPSTGSMESRQRYLESAASNGVDARYGWSVGATGANVRVIDVENSAIPGHEDQPSFFYQNGVMIDSMEHRNHGSATVGVIAAPRNGYGVTGIAHGARVGLGSTSFCGIFSCWQDSPRALRTAADHLGSGDILTIELHRPGPDSWQQCESNCKQFEFIAVEYWQADYDAIRYAVSKGIVVVEAAGNGSMNLDSSLYKWLFDRSVRDSGAILVGAGGSWNRAPHSWTNYGSRLDVQGWGDSVVTLGYGDLWTGGGDNRQRYTATFGGTSSGTAMVSGVAAAVQSYAKSRGLGVRSSRQMRALLRATGRAQASSLRQIGPLPNIRAALSGL